MNAKHELLRRVMSTEGAEAVRAVVSGLGAAQVANLLEALPPERRKGVWTVVAPRLKGEVLVEVRREVRRQLIEASSADELISAAG